MEKKLYIYIVHNQTRAEVRMVHGVNVLCDIVKDSVAGLLVLQPLACEDAGGGRVEFAAAQHAMAVSHPILEGAIVNLTTGIPAGRKTIIFLHCF